jgi:hypothetical protein
MNARGFKSLVLPALLAGTSRQPIDYSRLFDGTISPGDPKWGDPNSGDPKSGLKALALAGQARMQLAMSAAPLLAFVRATLKVLIMEPV